MWPIKPYPALGFKGAARSIIRWMIPFGNLWLAQTTFYDRYIFRFSYWGRTGSDFSLAHNMFLKEKIGFSLFTLNPTLADIFTWAVVVSAVLFALRRVALPEVRILTTAYDYFILFISAAPFITGLIARYQVGDYCSGLPFIFSAVKYFSLPFRLPNCHISHCFLPLVRNLEWIMG